MYIIIANQISHILSRFFGLKYLYIYYTYIEVYTDILVRLLKQSSDKH